MSIVVLIVVLGGILWGGWTCISRGKYHVVDDATAPRGLVGANIQTGREKTCMSNPAF